MVSYGYPGAYRYQHGALVAWKSGDRTVKGLGHAHAVTL